MANKTVVLHADAELIKKELTFLLLIISPDFSSIT